MYKVVPFHANISNQGTSTEVASSLEALIQGQEKEGWNFVQVQELTARVSGSAGCFGLGATPGTATSMAVVIFEKK